jgi:tetratricopeptide (TPR) repeat protein
VAYRNLKQYDKALSDLTQAIDITPDYIDAYIERGLLYDDLKKFPESISDFTKVIQLQPDHSFAYLARGFSEYYAGDKVTACRDLQKAKELGETLAQTYIDKYCK